MNAKIYLRQFLIIIKPRYFDTAEISVFYSTRVQNEVSFKFCTSCKIARMGVVFNSLVVIRAVGWPRSPTVSSAQVTKGQAQCSSFAVLLFPVRFEKGIHGEFSGLPDAD